MRKTAILFQALGVVLTVIFVACRQNDGGQAVSHPTRTFGAEVEFVSRYQKIIVLASANGQAKVLIVPGYQGRVLTSTTSGNEGLSLGWINHALIASGKLQPHMNAFGGEDRFWLGPEGGQFAIFFKPGDPFDLSHWQTPPPIDAEPFEVVEQSGSRVRFRKDMRLINYAGTEFQLQVEREIVLLDEEAIARHVGFPPGGVNAVAFETVNTITNTGSQTWARASGLLSIWILGMFNPSDETTVVIPLRTSGSDSGMVNDGYFGKVPADRLVVRNGVAYFSGDGKYRSKIGVPPSATKPVMGSYDPVNQVLTVVQFSFDSSATDYVNSAWELQERPYGGDVANSYNDGPSSPGAKPLGPFYELESSSAAKALQPGEKLTHTHRTFHFTGAERELDRPARQVLGVDLVAIKNALPRHARGGSN